MAEPAKKTAEEPGTRELILSSAAVLFREQGYAAVSLRGIAKTAGMTTGSLYYYFASKEEIVREILEQGHRHVLRVVRANIEALGAGAPAENILRTAIRTHVECLFGEDSFPAANIRIFAHVPPEIRTPSLAVRHDYERYWIALLDDCGVTEVAGREVDPAVLSNLLLGAMNWSLEWFRPGRHSVDEVVETLALLLLGQRGRSTGAPHSDTKG